ncbi:uncharacterized protein LOC121739218 [Aricia agestis]|uniref:uncharacterized protein LOC121739218 n=1 Tax=Aricia agestis TaxID=91739 RepID=UPI001C204D11|nr:uncharacterized protein LOC121739218 [Aricia agestis]
MHHDASIDIDRFISEVQFRPAVWDFNANFTRRERIKAWEEICEWFTKDYKNLSSKDRNAICHKLQRKWKSLRDCFNREIGKQKNSGDRKRKKYIYFKKLSFLKCLRDDIPNVPTSDDETSENDSGVEQQDKIEEKISSLEGPKKRKRDDKARQSIDKSEMQLFIEPEIDLSYSKCKCVKYEDPDRDFLMSILPDVKKIHDDLKIDFKSQVLQIIKNYRNVENFKS